MCGKMRERCSRILTHPTLLFGAGFLIGCALIITYMSQNNSIRIYSSNDQTVVVEIGNMKVYPVDPDRPSVRLYDAQSARVILEVNKKNQATIGLLDASGVERANLTATSPEGSVELKLYDGKQTETQGESLPGQSAERQPSVVLSVSQDGKPQLLFMDRGKVVWRAPAIGSSAQEGAKAPAIVDPRN